MDQHILDQYRPEAAWFLHDPYGIHGLAHAARALVWAEQVGQSMLEQGRAVDMEVVRWAAAVHDVGRVNDGIDKPHGQRSADWACSDVGRLATNLSDGQLQQLAYLCIWHVPADAGAPVMTPELICLKDADGLERVRIADLDPQKLRTNRARKLPRLAQELFRASCHPASDPWEGVRKCAIDMGLWR
jgi:uncharacterized protein